MRAERPVVLLAVALVGACGNGAGAAPQGSAAVFDVAADVHAPEHFFDLPYPLDTRRTATGAPDLAGLGNPIGSAVVEGLRAEAMDREGYPQMPVVYFRFDGPVATQDPALVVGDGAILLLDLDEGGALVPVVAQTLASDAYVPDGVLAVAPRPGWILAPKHAHGVVVLKRLGDASGRPLVAPSAFATLASDQTSSLGAAYAALWPALRGHGIAPEDVAVGTVFTTGDVVADTFALTQRVLSGTKLDIVNLHVDPDDGAAHDRYCELQGQITYPQFQGGAPPFDTDGLIHFGGDGMPIKTRDEMAPVTLSMPKTAMPSGGYPVVVYFHGTGGVSDAIADRGTWHLETDPTKCPQGELDTWNGKTGCNTKGTGPAYVVAAHGIGMVASALPVNPQRWPAGAKRDLPEYFNVNNVAATRDIFRQGIVEQRLLMEALARVRVDPGVVAACAGMSLPPGETAFRYATDKLLAQGQSMGAMYVNMLSATEPRVHATVATGAGGFWSYFILETSFIAQLPAKLGLLLGLHDAYTFLHPTMALAQTALEPADPMVYMPRVAQSPLPEHPSRSVYQPVGKGDSYFPTVVQDAVALAYRHPQAGDAIWPTMQDALGLRGLSGIVPYAVSQDVTSDGAAKTTGVVVQYDGDGVYDPHAIYSQLDAVKYQYGCFFASVLASGHATVPAPAPLGTPCPM
jgi:hypothetical protein